ncbi:hypothetical protein MTO96_015133, partial [Rhipicephalus appendiculatus]
SRLSAIFNRGLDPCTDFYTFACTDWMMTSADNEVYEDADDAIAGQMEELARGILEASASSDDLRRTLASFGLDFGKMDSPSAEDVLVVAANVFLGLGIAPLFSIALRPNPEDTNITILALNEADVLLGRMEASSYENVKQFTNLACKFLKVVHSAAEQDNSTKACMSVALVAIDMAKSSSKEEPLIDRMQNFTLMSLTELIAFQTMLSRIAKSEGKLRNDTMLAVKNPAQIGTVKSLLLTKVQSLFYYLGLHMTVYLSPFLEDGQPYEEATSFLLSGRSRSQPKWRICVRLVNMILPGFLMLAFEHYMNSSNTFSELMAYIMAEESRNAFIDEFSHLQRLDNWTKFIISEKIEAQVPETNQSFQYFLKLSAFVASKWTDTTWHIVSDGRRRVSLFNTDCYYDLGRSAVGECLPLPTLC